MTLVANATIHLKCLITYLFLLEVVNDPDTYIRYLNQIYVRPIAKCLLGSLSFFLKPESICLLREYFLCAEILSI